MYLKYEYSWLLIPSIIYLYYKYPNLRPYLIYFMIFISISGSLDTAILKNKIIKANKYKILGHIQYYLTLAIYLSLLFIIRDFYKDGYPNLISFGIMILTIIFIYITPHWPYFNFKFIFAAIYILLYIILSIIYTFIYILLASWRSLSTGS